MDNTDVTIMKLNDDNSFVAVTDFAMSNVIDMGSLRTLGSFEYKDEKCEACRGAIFSGSHNGEWTNPQSGEKYIVNWIGKRALEGAM